MTLEDLGYDDQLEAFRIEQNLTNFDVGRVLSEHRERYIVKTINGEFESEITGNMRFQQKAGRIFLPWAIGLHWQHIHLILTSFIKYCRDSPSLKDRLWGNWERFR